jgi:hypothetical protein
MEVHHHAHTARKKFLHYFWEFFMLFLAVFCGFLAENFREHKVERHREKEYVMSLVKDLEYDTMRFAQTIKRIQVKVPFYDSVFHFLHDPASFNNKLPFKFYIKTNIEQIYSPAEPTIQQLKSSGNLRLVENKLVLDSILIYDTHISGQFLNQTNYVVEYNKRLIQFQEKIFDNTNFNSFLNDVFEEKDAEDPDYSLLLISKDKEQLQELYNIFIGAKASEVFYISTLQSRKEEASGLIAFIKKEYHLE